MGLGNFFETAQRISSSSSDILDKVNTNLGYFGGPPRDSDGNPVTTGAKFPYRDHFLRMLETWDYSIPSKFLWIAYIDQIPQMINTDVFQTFEGTNGSKAANNIDSNRSYLTRHDAMTTDAGCIFCNGVNLPGEEFTTQHVKINNNRGFIPSVIASGRNEFQPLILSFRETNTSFVDNIVRPWTILAGHRGLVARPNENIKTTIQVLQLGKTTSDTALVSRKIFRFYNCVPTRVEPVNLTYDAGEIQEMSTNWVFSHYDIEQLPNMSVQMVVERIIGRKGMGLLDKVTKGKFSKILNKGGKVADTVIKGAKTAARVEKIIEKGGKYSKYVDKVKKFLD